MAFLIGGCTATPRPEPIEAPAAEVVVEPDPVWMTNATAADINRLSRLDEAWSEGLAAARKGGFRRKVADEGVLLEQDAALPRPEPSPGSYMCRLIRLGSTAKGEAAFAAFKPFFCHVGVDQNQLSITKQTGTQRPAGYLWEDREVGRMIFLGSLAPGEEEPLAYGEDAARDVAGIFERVAPFRYRLVIPWPQNGAKLEVYELVPAPAQAEEARRSPTRLSKRLPSR